VLGLSLDSASPAEEESQSDPRIDALVAEREAARKAKDFETSDRIRDELAAEGVIIVDSAEGPRWSRK
jgi:cysteinyl-tRNA synthetase